MTGLPFDPDTQPERLMPTDGPWTIGVKRALARGDTQEVAALRGSILLLLSMAGNPEISDSEFGRAYDDMARQHGLGEQPKASLWRRGWRRAAGLMLMK